MTTSTYFKTLLLIATCLFFLSCNSSSPQKLVRLEYGDSILFSTPSGLAVPLDLKSVEMQTRLDVGAQNNSAFAHLAATVKESGQPYFLCDCVVKSISVNGQLVQFERLIDPDQQNSLIMIKHFYSIADQLEIALDFSLKASAFSFQTGGVGLLSSMSDLQDGNFFEEFGPTNFEFDQYALRWQVDILNSTSPHQLFTNGASSYSTDVSTQSWTIDFPSYFTSSSPFVHLTNRSDLVVKKFEVALKEKNLPVTVYGSSSSLVNQASVALPSYFSELENDYGSYAHDSFVALITSSGGGMEYAGATITSFGALDHELTHSWFARGVMPADGRSGWIDEAVASWRDYGYSRAPNYNQRSFTNLANFSPFERFTPRNCYRDGRALLSELDFVFAAQGGFKKILNELFALYKRQTITTQLFMDFVESKAPVDLRPLFTKNVYGNFMIPEETQHVLSIDDDSDSKHPSPLTLPEIIELR
jgi:hypothetical protein